MSNPTEPKHTLMDSFEEGRLAEWLSHQGKNIIYGIIAVLVLLGIFYRFSSSHSVKQEQDYLKASQDFALFTSADSAQDADKKAAALKDLDAIMSRHNELHAAYDGTIAQTLLERNQVAEALPYATATLARTTSDALPLYADFAKTTLVISQANYAAALTQAEALQEQMIQALNAQPAQPLTFSADLFALNLLRIGMLQQQLGDKTAELSTWKAWKQYAALDNPQGLPAKVDPQAFRAVMQQLAIGTFSLPDYIAYREKTLAK